MDTEIRLSSGVNVPVTDTYAIGGNAAWTSDKWTATLDIAYSDARTEFTRYASELITDTPVNIVWTRAESGVPNQTIAGINDGSTYLVRNSGLQFPVISSDNEFSARLDLTRDFDVSIFDSLAFGVRYSDRDNGQTQLQQSFGDINGTTAAGLPTLSLPSAYDGTIGGANVGTFLVLDPIAVAGLQGFPGSLDASSQTDSQTFNVNEKILAGYVMANFSSESGLRGNIGVRIVNTDTATTGFSVSDASLALATSNLSDLVTDFVTLGSEYTEILPSLSVAYNLSENTIFRGGIAKTLTRQQISDLRPSVRFSSIQPGNVVGRASNPDLEPFTAWSFDAGIEHYIGDTGLIAVNVFYKDVGGFTFSETVTDVTLVGIPFDELTLVDNAASAEIAGFELLYQQVFDFLPAPFDGFGVQANYTYTDNVTNFDSDANLQSDPDDISFIGIPRESYNLVGFYEKGPLSARLAYTWKGVFSPRGTIGGNPVNAQPYGQIDARISYDVRDNMTVFVEGINLGNEDAVQFFGDLEQELAEYSEFGRRLHVGVRFEF